MTSYSFVKSDIAALKTMKQRYTASTTAALDGMWEIFADMADHYAVCEGEKIVGYFAINDQQKLMQFYLPEASDSIDIFHHVITKFNVNGAFVSTAEPAYLSLCLDRHKHITVNALMYHVGNAASLGEATFPSGCEFRLVAKGELETAVAFALEAIGASEEWLTGYYGEHIAQEQLYGLWQNDKIIAAGELRKSASQKPIADVGMVVSPQHRGGGIATNVLLHLRRLARESGLTAICSTENENIAAQKAITRAGFISHHRVLEITF